MELDIDNALNIGEDEFYRATRYKIPLTVVLINSNNKNAFNILESCTRKSDILQQLTSDTSILYLSHTNFKDSTLFMEKIKNKFIFTYTIEQYKNSEQQFLKNLFSKNNDKIDFD